MNLKNLKNIKGGLSRDEMKTITGGSYCSATCGDGSTWVGADCAGTCTGTNGVGVKCNLQGGTVVNYLCKRVDSAPK